MARPVIYGFGHIDFRLFGFWYLLHLLQTISMIPSQLLFDLLEHFEGLRLTAYKDVAGIWTIGYGTTYYPNQDRVYEGETCTKEEAQACLVNALMHFIDHLNATKADNLTQAQFDALCCFIYNVGQGAWDSSSLRISVNSKPLDFDVITADFLKWDKAHVNGQLVEVEGLKKRRLCEAYLFQWGVNAPDFIP